MLDFKPLEVKVYVHIIYVLSKSFLKVSGLLQFHFIPTDFSFLLILRVSFIYIVTLFYLLCGRVTITLFSEIKGNANYGDIYSVLSINIFVSGAVMGLEIESK